MTAFSFFLTINVLAASSQTISHSLIEELRLGGVTDSVIQAPITDLAVGRQRVYVLMTRDQHVAVFTTAGQYLGQIGRKGRGPGEFLQPWKIGLVGDTLWVSDIALQSITMFDPDGLVSVRGLSSAEWNATQYQPTPPVGVLSNGSFLVEAFLAPDKVDEGLVRQPLLLFDPVSDQFTVFKWRTVQRAYMIVITNRGSAFGPQPLSDSPLYDVASDGRAVAMIDREVALQPGSHEFRVRKYVANQSRLQLQYDLKYPYQATRVPERLKDSLVADRGRRLARLFDSRREVADVVNEKLFLPEFYPAVSGLTATLDGRTWIQLTSNNPRRSQWLVLDAHGSVWGSVDGGRTVRILEARLNTVWGVDVDSAGIQYLVRHRLTPVP